MSEDIQVSNTRRAVFTAMALVVFWASAWNAYWFACGDTYEGDVF